MKYKYYMIRMTFAILFSPRTWKSALIYGKRLKPNDGLLPPKNYVQFRLQTAYGNSWYFNGKDFCSFIRWAAKFPLP